MINRLIYSIFNIYRQMVASLCSNIDRDLIKLIINCFRNFMIIFFIIGFIILCVNRFDFDKISIELSISKSNWSNINDKNYKIFNVFEKVFKDFFNKNTKLLYDFIQLAKEKIDKNEKYLPSVEEIKDSFEDRTFPATTWFIRRSINAIIFCAFCMLFFHISVQKIYIYNIFIFLADCCTRLIWFPLLKIKYDFWNFLKESDLIKTIKIGNKTMKIEAWLKELKIDYDYSETMYDRRMIKLYRLLEIDTINKNKNSKNKTNFEYDWKKDPMNNDSEISNKIFNDMQDKLYTKCIKNVPPYCEDNDGSLFKHWNFWVKIFNNESLENSLNESFKGHFPDYVVKEPIFKFFIDFLNSLIQTFLQLLKSLYIISDTTYLRLLEQLNISSDYDFICCIITVFFYLFIYMHVFHSVLFLKISVDWNFKIFLLINNLLLFLNINNFISKFFIVTIIIIGLFIIIWQFIFTFLIRIMINLFIHTFRIIHNIIISIIRTIWYYFKEYLYSTRLKYYSFKIKYYFVSCLWYSKLEYILIFFQLYIIILFSLLIRLFLVLDYVFKTILIFIITMYIFVYFKILLISTSTYDFSNLHINFIVFSFFLYVSFKLLFKNSFSLMEKLHNEWKYTRKDHKLFRSGVIDQIFQEYQKYEESNKRLKRSIKINYKNYEN